MFRYRESKKLTIYYIGLRRVGCLVQNFIGNGYMMFKWVGLKEKREIASWAN
jgi:hypothetical protein